MHILLRLCIAFYLNVTFPKIGPGGFMKLQQPVTAFELGKNGGAFGFVQRVVMMRGRDRGTGNRKFIRFACFYFSRPVAGDEFIAYCLSRQENPIGMM